MGICDVMSNTGKDMAFYPGFELKATKEPFGFQYGDVVIVPPGCVHAAINAEILPMQGENSSSKMLVPGKISLWKPEYRSIRSFRKTKTGFCLWRILRAVRNCGRTLRRSF